MWNRVRLESWSAKKGLKRSLKRKKIIKTTAHLEARL